MTRFIFPSYAERRFPGSVLALRKKLGWSACYDATFRLIDGKLWASFRDHQFKWNDNTWEMQRKPNQG